MEPGLQLVDRSLAAELTRQAVAVSPQELQHGRRLEADRPTS